MKLFKEVILLGIIIEIIPKILKYLEYISLTYMSQMGYYQQDFDA